MKQERMWTPLDESKFIPYSKRKCFYNKDRICDSDCAAYNDWEYSDKISCSAMNKVIKRDIKDLKEEDD